MDAAAGGWRYHLSDMGPAIPTIGPLRDGDAELQSVLRQYHQVRDILGRFSNRRKLCGALVLVLSVLTSGALWLLVGEAVPKPALWAGAVMSTLTTGITLYVYSSGMLQTIASSLALYRSIGKFLACVRSEAIPESEYWDKVKGFEFELEKIRSGQVQDF